MCDKIEWRNVQFVSEKWTNKLTMGQVKTNRGLKNNGANKWTITRACPVNAIDVQQVVIHSQKPLQDSQKR